MASLVRSSISSASSLIALQLVSRLFTFGLNQVLLRLVSPSAYGTVAIQFELVLNTILFLSREGVRNALLRASKDKMKENSSVANLSFLPILVGVPLASLVTLLYGSLAGKDVRSQPHFVLSIWVYALAAIVELLAEPMHNVAMSELRTDIRVRAEGLGVTMKTIVTFLVLYHDSRQGTPGSLALLAFALGQLSYSVSLVTKYVSVYGIRSLLPWSPSVSKLVTIFTCQPSSMILLRFRENTAPFWERTLLRVSLSMTAQCIVKHFLTEGDKLILSWFSPLQDQGGYAVAVNYGSLIARIGFQPIEETLRVFFSRTLSSSKEPRTEELKTASRTIAFLVSAQISFSFLLIAFAPPYLPIALRILLPLRYLGTSAPTVLRAWIYYLPFLALNGGLEAFVSSVANPEDLAKQSRYMACFSALYTAIAVAFYRFTSLGDTSLVYANIINLAARIGYCIHFTNMYYSKFRHRHLLSWSETLPPRPFALATLLSGVLLRTLVDIPVSSKGLALLLRKDVISSIVCGGLLALACASMWWRLSIPKALHS
ncbi:Rft-1 domain containing protein [Amanita muscaria]